MAENIVPWKVSVTTKIGSFEVIQKFHQGRNRRSHRRNLDVRERKELLTPLFSAMALMASASSG